MSVFGSAIALLASDAIEAVYHIYNNAMASCDSLKEVAVDMIDTVKQLMGENCVLYLCISLISNKYVQYVFYVCKLYSRF